MQRETGIVDHMYLKITDNWAKCAGCTVDLIEEDGNEYLITRSDSRKTHIVHLENKRCSCGEWQEYNVPCIDVCAVFQLKFEKSCDTVLDLCSTLYRWETIQKIFKLNIKPVPTETLARDGVTKPPKKSKKRSAGRPKTQRIRKRTKANPKIIIKCSKCGKTGHNKSTCDTRQALKNKGLCQQPDLL
jgi:SWIM zinc finger